MKLKINIIFIFQDGNTDSYNVSTCSWNGHKINALINKLISFTVSHQYAIIICRVGKTSPQASVCGSDKKQSTGSGNGSSRHVTSRGGKSELSRHGGATKTTRIRTVLNEKQLHTLRTCYAANPRPDALMKDQLVEMTGLSSRVIRVWFQNKRCKDKKRTILIKQLQQQHHDKV